MRLLDDYISVNGVLDPNLIKVNVSVEGVLKNIDKNVIKEYVESYYDAYWVEPEDANNYVDIEKSVGTEPFYDMLVKYIEEGKLSLEMLIGKVTLKKLQKENKQ